MPAAASSGSSSKTKWIVGCAALLTLACFGGIGVAYMLFQKGAEAVAEGASGIVVEGSRLSLQMRLTSMKLACQGDPSGAAAATNFAPSVAASLQSQACGVTDEAIAAFADSTKAPGETLAGTDQEGLAGQVGADPNACARFAAGSQRIAGCTLSDGNFVIVAMEGFASAGGGAAQPTAQAPSGGGACGKAAECCTAFYQAMASTPAGAAYAGQGEQACQALRQAAQAGPSAEPGCTQAIASWRQGLTAMNVAVPAACQ
jgi:hypothetical protein